MARELKRREVIAGGGLVAVGGILVACGGGDSASESTTDVTAEETAAEETTAESSQAETAEEIAEVEDTEALGDVLTSVDEVPVEGGVVISDPPVVVVQPTSGDFKGFSAVCPHQGCLMSSVESNEILCPCHGSLFSAEDGSVIAGPAQEGLPAVPVSVQGDSVVLD
jgi:Rieske Fe-S protein